MLQPEARRKRRTATSSTNLETPISCLTDSYRFGSSIHHGLDFGPDVQGIRNQLLKFNQEGSDVAAACPPLARVQTSMWSCADRQFKFRPQNVSGRHSRAAGVIICSHDNKRVPVSLEA